MYMSISPTSSTGLVFDLCQSEAETKPSNCCLATDSETSCKCELYTRFSASVLLPNFSSSPALHFRMSVIEVRIP